MRMTSLVISVIGGVLALYSCSVIAMVGILSNSFEAVQIALGILYAIAGGFGIAGSAIVARQNVLGGTFQLIAAAAAFSGMAPTAGSEPSPIVPVLLILSAVFAFFPEKKRQYCDIVL